MWGSIRKAKIKTNIELNIVGGAKHSSSPQKPQPLPQPCARP